MYGSIYDVFGYRGHAFDVSEKNKNLNVSIIIKDIDNHIWKNKTIFTLGEIDEKLLYATTAE